LAEARGGLGERNQEDSRFEARVHDDFRGFRSVDRSHTADDHHCGKSPVGTGAVSVPLVPSTEYVTVRFPDELGCAENVPIRVPLGSATVPDTEPFTARVPVTLTVAPATVTEPVTLAMSR